MLEQTGLTTCMHARSDQTDTNMLNNQSDKRMHYLSLFCLKLTFSGNSPAEKSTTEIIDVHEYLLSEYVYGIKCS